MAGLNHELSRELLWREFPASLAGTAFRQFWDVSGQPGDPEALADIPPISEWGERAAGRAPARRRRPARAARPRRAAAPLPDDHDLRRPRDGRRRARRDDPAGADVPRRARAGHRVRGLRAQRGERAGDRSGRAGLVLRLRGVPGRAALRVRRGRRRRRPEDGGRARLGARAAHGLRPRRRLQAAVRRRQPAGGLGPQRGRHGIADVPAAVPRGDARVAPAREEQLDDRPRGDRHGARARAGGRGRRARARRPARRGEGRPQPPARRPRAASRAHHRAAAGGRGGAGARGRGDAGARRRWPPRRAPPRRSAATARSRRRGGRRGGRAGASEL